jgi:hypothetical protein
MLEELPCDLPKLQAGLPDLLDRDSSKAEPEESLVGRDFVRRGKDPTRANDDLVFRQLFHSNQPLLNKKTTRTGQREC